MTTRVGDFDLVHSVAFMARDLQPAIISASVAGSDIVFEIKFDSSEPGFAGAMTWNSRGNTIELIFKGWRNLVGAFGDPVRIGDVNGVALFVQIAHSKIGDPSGGSNLVHFFVLTKGAPPKGQVSVG